MMNYRGQTDELSEYKAGEFLQDFQKIEDALHENVRADDDETLKPVDEDETPPFSSSTALPADASTNPKADIDEPGPPAIEESPEDFPFSSVTEAEKKTEKFSATVADNVVYRQARRGKRRHHGRQGVWRFLPHIGHRRRHWIQRNIYPILTYALLIAILVPLLASRIRPRFNLSVPDDFHVGSTLQEQGSYKEAIDHYKQFLSSRSEPAFRRLQATFYLGTCYEALEQPVEAQNQYWDVWMDYERRVEEEPTDQIPLVPPREEALFAQALLSLGDLAMKSPQAEPKDFQTAIKHYEKLLKYFPDSIFAGDAVDCIERAEMRQEELLPEVVQQGLESDEPEKMMNDIPVQGELEP